VRRTLRIGIVRGLLLVTGFLPVSTAGNAQAAGLNDKAAGELQEAKRLYKSGRYEEAAEIFSRLSASYPEFPVFARNAGACYYYLQRPEPAISNLRDYLLSQRRVSPEDRAEVEGWIAEMEKLRDQNAPLGVPAKSVATGPVPSAGSADPGHLPNPPRSQGSGTTFQGNSTVQSYGYDTSMPPTAALDPRAAPTGQATQAADSGKAPSATFPPQVYGGPAGAPAVAAPPPGGYSYSQGYPPTAPGQSPYVGPLPASPQYPSPVQGSPGVAINAENSQENRATSSNGTAWLVGGLGVAVLATGSVFTYLSQSAFSDTVKQYNASKESSGKTYADVAGVCYGVGAAGVATAAILAIMNQHRTSSSVALAPVVRPDTVGAVVHYSY